MTDDDRSIEQLIKQAGGAFDPSADLPDRIGRRVRQRQVRRRVAVSLCAGLLAVLVVGGGLVIAGDDGPDRELETATDGPTTTSSTTAPPSSAPTSTTAPTTTSPPATGTPPVAPEEGAATTLFVLQSDLDQLVEVSLATGDVERQVIPLTGMTDFDGRGDEEWWVRREEIGSCGNFRWEEFHAVGAGGFPYPDAVETALSPDDRFLAYVRRLPDACEGAAEVVVRDLASGAEAVTPAVINPRHLTWRSPSEELAYSVEDDPNRAGDERIDTAPVSTAIVAGGSLAPITKIAPDGGCSVHTPVFVSGDQAMYVRTCEAAGPDGEGTTTIVTEGVGADLGSEVEVVVDDPGSLNWLAVHPVTRQVAFVADGGAWVVEDGVPRKVVDNVLKVRWPMAIPG